MIRRWIVVCSGFLQHEGSPNGIESLWVGLRRYHNDPDTSIEYRPWDTNWKRLAEFMFRLRSRDTSDPPKIMLVGYSWGGWGAIVLAEELAKRGIEVQTLILSDAVYRPRWMVFKWLAMTNLPKLRVPENVVDCHWFRQRKNYPRGQEVVPTTHFRTRVHAPIILDVTHQYADDAGEFHDLTYEKARELCDP